LKERFIKNKRPLNLAHIYVKNGMEQKIKHLEEQF
jgi:hypothetical protein